MNNPINSANLGFEKEIFAAADKLRGNIDAAEYKNVVLGLIFLKYISDSFEDRYQELVEEGEGFEEDRDEYLYKNIFFVPKEARWDYIASKAMTPEIGQVIDKAMVSIEEENDRLNGILPKNYARPELDKRRLGEVVDLFNNLKLKEHGDSKDILGRTYEYALAQFASLEGKNAGEFYTPSSVVETLVEILQPYEGRVYDPCCGAGGMFVQSAKFVENHQRRVSELSIFGQESNANTWKLAQMNLAIHALEGDLGSGHADTFFNDLHPTMRADFILANPPFNMKDWGGDRLVEDARWKYGLPPAGNSNYAWMQHMIYHLSPKGKMGLVLANGSLSASGREGEIRVNIIKDDLVECIIAMPDRLFYSTGISVSLWIINKDKKQKGKTLFLDCRSIGHMIDRAHRDLSDEDIDRIAGTYKNFVDGKDVQELGFAHVADLEEIEENNFVLTPGRYVGLEEVEDDGELFEEKMERLTSELSELFAESHRLEALIKEQLGRLDMEYKLSELVNLKYGKSQKEVASPHGKYPIMGTGGIIGYASDFLYDKPSVLIGRKGSIQNVFYIDEPFWTIDTLFYTEINESKVIPRYLFYKFKTMDLMNYNEGTTIPSLRTQTLNEISLNVSDLNQQKRIVEILYNYDQKIELNNEIIANLEAQAQAIFKSWFVDFEPFQDGEFVESELGLIPVGWGVKSLDEIANYKNGLAMQKFPPENDLESLPVLKIQELRKNSTGESSDRCSSKISEDVKVYDGDIIFSWSATLMVKVWTGGNAGLNQHLFKVTSDVYDKWFYYLWTSYHLKRFQVIARDKATTMGHIKRSHLKEALTLVPDSSTYCEMSKLMNPIIEMIVNLGVQNRTLAQIRDTLLPKLMSGEIDVSNIKIDSEEIGHV